MELYQPQVRLFVQRNFDEPDEYFLHSVTYCPSISYRADGHRPIPAELDGDGAWVVGLKIRKDPAIPDFRGASPVVHTVALGSAPGEAEDVPVKVELWVEEEGPRARSIAAGDEEKPKTTSTVSTTSASEESRPIRED